MEQEIADLRNEIAELRGDVKELVQEVKRLNKTSNRMDDHITFVNSVYTTVRQPFSYILGNVYRVMGKTQNVVLPQLKDV
jgi:predicted nuclease with TOPRIM domain